MNDEPTPPPALRLKPRLRPAGEQAAPPVEAGPVPGPFPDGVIPFPVPPPPSWAPVEGSKSEGSKFKLKPKTETVPPPTSIPSAPSARGASTPPPATRTPFAPIPAATVPNAVPAPASGRTMPPMGMAPSLTRPPVPPFPVIASGAPAPRRTAPPFSVPHLKVNLEVAAAPVAELEPEPKQRGSAGLLIGALVIVALSAGGFFAWPYLKAALATPAATPLPVAAAPTAAVPPPKPAPVAAAPVTPGPTPSDTLNKIAHMPANAINKAQDAIAARRANGQSRVDAAALGEDQPAKPAPAASKGPATSTTMTSVSPGLAATMQMEAAPEATPAFLAWVVNAKVNGVFQGSPARAMINGRLTRAGETVDGALGITFDSVDADKKNLVFKDRSGATVSRKY